MIMAVVDRPGLAGLSLHANPRAKSCLRSILTEYGLKEERRRRKPPRQTRSAGWHRETHKADDGRGKLTIKQEKHLQVLKDLDVLRDHYYDTYMDMLRERIAQQEMKMREREARVARRQKTAPPVKKKEKHVLVDDKHYLQNVAKSEVYEIVREESRLIQAGLLRTPSDLEEFWSRHLLKNAAKDMARRYNVSDASTFLSDSAFAEESAAKPSLSFLSKIREEEEEMSARTGEKKPVRRTIAHKGTTSRKSMKDIDEILFPKVEMPKLHCFEMELGPKEEDPATTEAQNEQSLRDKERWLFRKRLQKMYQLAMTNTASAKRILANHDPEDVEIMTDSSDVKELINLDHFITKTDLRRYSSQSNALVPYRGQGQGQGHGESHVDSGQGQSSLSREARTAVSEDMVESSETKSRAIESATSNSRSSATSRTSRPKSSSSRGSHKDPQAPLSMDDILPEARIMEPKCLSTLWTNYMFNSEGNKT